ncbi:MAG: flagellar motor switch protein FliN [Pseudomonadota bacterium]
MAEEDGNTSLDNQDKAEKNESGVSIDDNDSDDFLQDIDTTHSEISLDKISEIPVTITAIIGRTSMTVSQLLKLSRGAVVELDRKVGEPVEIYVNDRLIAKGEIVIVEDRIGITLTELSNKGIEKEVLSGGE